jgi:hypothetical protein
MKALRVYAGRQALAHIQREGLQPQDVQTIAAAAGGPKGLILGPLDEYLFGTWLPQSSQPIDLIGASIGAWRMSAACLNDPVAAFRQLAQDYMHQHYELQPGQTRPSAEQVTHTFSQALESFYGGRVDEVLNHPRYRLHIVTSRGKHWLSREHRVWTPLGYGAAFLTNVLSRRALGHWLERVVFSSRGELPMDVSDLLSQQVVLNQDNFMQALLASCSIPFVLKAVEQIAHAPSGAYWDGGITDYHLHFNYKGLVLYPHFQKTVVPGWLDKSLKWRHHSTPFLDRVVVLAPDPEWVKKTLPNGKLPDRTDFIRYGDDLQARVKVWQQAVDASQQLVDEWQQWLHEGGVVEAL